MFVSGLQHTTPSLFLLFFDGDPLPPFIVCFPAIYNHHAPLFLSLLLRFFNLKYDGGGAGKQSAFEKVLMVKIPSPLVFELINLFMYIKYYMSYVICYCINKFMVSCMLPITATPLCWSPLQSFYIQFLFSKMKP